MVGCDIMLEILQYIFSNFWIWLGVTVWIVAVCDTVADFAKAVRSQYNKDEEE